MLGLPGPQKVSREEHLGFLAGDFYKMDPFNSLTTSVKAVK